MKRFVIVLAALSALGLGSCTIKSYEIKSMENKQTIEVEDFINLKPLIVTSSSNIYVDKNTDVLYLREYHILCPIMKADGTCLTLTEWKEGRK